MGKIRQATCQNVRRPAKKSVKLLTVEKSARFFFDIYIEKSGADFDGFYLAILKKTWGMRHFS